MTATKAEAGAPASERGDLAGIRLTLPERLLGALPGPFLLYSLLLAVFLGFPGFLLFYWLDSGTVRGALDANFRGFAPEERWRQVAMVAAWMAFAFYGLWMARAVRLSVLTAEGAVAPLVPGGGETYRAAFGRLSATAPPLLVALLLAGVTYPFTVTALREAAGPWEFAYDVVRAVFVYTIYGAALWAYGAALWGVRTLGTLPLRRRPFVEDSMLGLRPIGSLALSISFLYYGWMAILIAIALVNPVYVQLVLVLIALTVLGVVLFVWPLDGVHRQMAVAKGEQQAALRRSVFRLAEDPASAPAARTAEADLATTLDALRSVLVDWRQSLALEAAERKVAGMPVWPFDTAILRRLGSVVLPMLLALVTKGLPALVQRVTG